MEKELKIKMYSFTLDCINPYALAKFYAELLNWEIPFYDENWACIGVPGMSQGAYPGILFQRNPEYCPPGATMAAEQFSEEWRVMFDPAGHPFCLCRMKAIFESEKFALL